MSRILTGFLCTFLLAGAALAQTRDMSASGVALDRVVAVVNDGIVLQSQLDTQTALIAERLRGQGTQLPPADVLRQQVLERLVLQEIQMQRATRLGVQVSDEMLNEALRDVAKRNNIPFEQMPAALEQQGIDYAAYREEMRARDHADAAAPARRVSAHLRLAARARPGARARCGPGEHEHGIRRLAHPALAARVGDDGRRWRRSRTLRTTSTERAVQGEDFGQLALAYSKAQTALERGKLGWRRMNQLPQFIGELVANMKPGDVSEPIRTPTGFHLVRLDDTRGGDSGPVMVEQIHARHILMRPNEVQDDATTRQRLDAIRDRILAGEDFGALASVTSEDPGSASRGGDLGWNVPGTFVPEFESALAALKENEISEPFRTQFGWHIVQLLGRRTHDQSDELRRQRVLTRRCARARSTRKPSCGCDDCATRPYVEITESLTARRASSSRPASPPASGRISALAAALVDWPCELVFVGDPGLLAARAEQLRISLRPTDWREAARPVPHRAGTLPVLASTLAARHRPAGSIPPTRATCSRCSMPRPRAASPGASTRWSRRRCRRASINDAGIPFRATPNTSPNAAAARTR